MYILVSNEGFIAKSSVVADKIGSTLSNYAEVFKNIEDEHWQSDKCNGLAAYLKNDDTAKRIKQLSALINKLSYSLIMVFGFCN